MSAAYVEFMTFDDDPSPPPFAPKDLEALLVNGWARVRDETGITDYDPIVDERPVEKQKRERALMFRLGVHVQCLLRQELEQLRRSVGDSDRWGELTVDMELARARQHPKLRSNESVDLVIHVRGTDSYNLLAVEAKHINLGSERQKDVDTSELQRLSNIRRYRNTLRILLSLDQDLSIEQIPARPPHD
jgi:hypothetical protein